MRAYLFIKHLFLALIKSAAWYWSSLWIFIVLLLVGAPEWVERFPESATMIGAVDVPYWAYGLAASVVVAIFFAWRIADMTTPRVVPTRIVIGPFAKGNSGTNYRVEVENISFSECDRMMCVLQKVNKGCAIIPFDQYDQHFQDFATDFPVVLTTQGRLRWASENNQPLDRKRWHLDPGEKKNVELFQVKPNAELSVVHEGGTETLSAQSHALTFEVILSGGVPPVRFWVVIFFQGLKSVVFLAKDCADMSAIQQFSSSDFFSTAATPSPQSPPNTEEDRQP